MTSFTSDLYRNRLKVIPLQMEYSTDDYVVYPDVIRNRWVYKQPDGNAVFTGQGATTNGSPLLLFKIDPMQSSDPKSYRLYFKCYVNDSHGSGSANTTTALCNFAHSVFNQAILRFIGTSAGQVEQINNYDVFSSMISQFYSNDYINSVSKAVEGYTDLTSAPSGYAGNPGAAARLWNGRSFMMPINLGLFISCQKFIPNFLLPMMELQFNMETVARATCAYALDVDSDPVPTSSPNYYITGCQLIYNLVETIPAYQNDMRQKVFDAAQAGRPYRLDFQAWSGFNSVVPSGGSGQTRFPITKNITALRKIMFGMVNATYGTDSINDAINSFRINNLGSYRFIIGGKFYPDQEVNVNPSNALPTYELDNSMAFFFNMYAIGIPNQIYTGFRQDWEATSSNNNPNALGLNDSFVYIWSTDVDDAGLATLYDLEETGQLDLQLTFSSTTSTNINCYTFLLVNRAILIYPGNSIAVING